MYLPLYFEKGMQLFIPSCRQMMAIPYVITSSDVSFSGGELGFTIYYNSKTFKSLLRKNRYAIKYISHKKGQ